MKHKVTKELQSQ